MACLIATALALLTSERSELSSAWRLSAFALSGWLAFGATRLAASWRSADAGGLALLPWGKAQGGGTARTTGPAATCAAALALQLAGAALLLLPGAYRERPGAQLGLVAHPPLVATGSTLRLELPLPDRRELSEGAVGLDLELLCLAGRGSGPARAVDVRVWIERRVAAATVEPPGNAVAARLAGRERMRLPWASSAATQRLVIAAEAGGAGFALPADSLTLVRDPVSPSGVLGGLLARSAILLAALLGSSLLWGLVLRASLAVPAAALTTLGLGRVGGLGALLGPEGAGAQLARGLLPTPHTGLQIALAAGLLAAGVLLAGRCRRVGP